MESRDHAHRSPSELSRAIVAALAYADVFDYPLTARQIHRFLANVPADLDQVEAALSNDPWLAPWVEQDCQRFCLHGRSQVLGMREVSTGVAPWRRAVRGGFAHRGGGTGQRPT